MLGIACLTRKSNNRYRNLTLLEPDEQDNEDSAERRSGAGDDEGKPRKPASQVPPVPQADGYTLTQIENAAYHKPHQTTDLWAAWLYLICLLFAIAGFFSIYSQADFRWLHRGIDHEGRPCDRGTPYTAWCGVRDASGNITSINRVCSSLCPDGDTPGCPQPSIHYQHWIPARGPWSDQTVEVVAILFRFIRHEQLQLQFDSVGESWDDNVTTYQGDYATQPGPYCHLSRSPRIERIIDQVLTFGPLRYIHALQRLAWGGWGISLLIACTIVVALVSSIAFILMASACAKALIFVVMALPAICLYFVGLVCFFHVALPPGLSALEQFEDYLGNNTELLDYVRSNGSDGDVRPFAGFENATSRTLDVANEMLQRAGIEMMVPNETLDPYFVAFEGIILMALGNFVLRLSKGARTDVNIGVGVAEAAANMFADLPKLIVSIMLTTFLKICVIIGMACGFIAILSAGQMERHRSVLDFVFGHFFFFGVHGSTKLFLLYYVAMCVWTLNIWIKTERFVVDYATQIWYSQAYESHKDEDKEAKPLHPDLASFAFLMRGGFVALRFHFGSIVLAALAVDLLWVIHTSAKLMRIAIFEGTLTLSHSALSNRFFSCLKKNVMPVINVMLHIDPDHALLWVCLSSESIGVAYHRAYKVIRNDLLGIEYLSGALGIIQPLSGFFCVFFGWLIPTTIMYRAPGFSDENSPLYVDCNSLLTLIIAAISLAIGSSLVQILRYAADTFLFCWALDREYISYMTDTGEIGLVEHRSTRPPSLPGFMNGPPNPGRINRDKIFTGRWESKGACLDSILGGLGGLDIFDEGEAEGHCLRVTVVSAHNLPNMDETWMDNYLPSYFVSVTDAYVICEALSPDGSLRSKFRTKTVASDLNPEFKFDGRITNFRDGDKLLFTIWDQDWGVDDYIGTATLPGEEMMPFYNLNNKELEIELPAKSQGLPGMERAPTTLTVRVQIDVQAEMKAMAGGIGAACTCCSCCASCIKCCLNCCSTNLLYFMASLTVATCLFLYIMMQAGVLAPLLAQMAMYVYVTCAGLAIIGFVGYTLYGIIGGFMSWLKQEFFLLKSYFMMGPTSLGFFDDDTYEEDTTWKAKRSPPPTLSEPNPLTGKRTVVSEIHPVEIETLQFIFDRMKYLALMEPPTTEDGRVCSIPLIGGCACAEPETKLD